MGSEVLLHRERLYTGRVLGLRRDTVRMERARGTVEVTREVVEHGAAVVVVPRDPRGRVLLVRQFRWATGQELLEAPAGRVDPGEEPEAAAARELREEVGQAAGRLAPLGGFWMVPGYSTEFMHAYLATGLQPDPLPPDQDEEIEVAAFPWEAIPGLVGGGQVRDAKSVAALLMAYYLHPGQPRAGG